MASIVLSNAASYASSSLNSYFGLSSIPIFGSQINSQIRGLTKDAASNLGGQLDELFFGANQENTVKGPKLIDLAVQTSTYGDVIPLVYGRTRIAGNILWAQDIKENSTTTSQGGGKGGTFGVTRKTTTKYNYTLTFAVAICEGEIDKIDRIWADSKLIDLSKYCASYEIHKGSKSQEPSSIIETFEGIGKTPAYRELAYVVFENFDLSSFGNRIPNLTFEVNKQTASSFESEDEKIENLLTEITLIPGAGEYVYDTKIQSKVYGRDVAGKWVRAGYNERINAHASNSKTDIMVSVENMKQTFPNLEWVSIVVAWYADSLDISTATINPKVDFQEGAKVFPDNWNVAGVNRENANLVTLDENGRAIYGGTPSDSSVTNLIDELKNQGFKVMLYPMIFVDEVSKPWRGKMTGEVAEISNFFSRANGYNNFINHYANLTKNKVDAFLIGTEMKALTSIQNSTDNSFPAVDEFISLANSVKTKMGASTQISYAADWSEYHSVNGWFNMDKLWASVDIDFIGIDAYFPLTDEPQNNVYDLQKVVDGWTNGEGYEWYYTNEERTIKASLDAKYAWKNIEYWWKNSHTNPDDSITNWVAESKQIWFTEFGFPSVDGATNQPNVFYNPNSIDGGLPHHSNGYVDILAQKLGIEATLRKWQNSGMIERKFLWAWDARPYPYWPDNKSVWSDGEVWSRGHWVQGKLGTSDLGSVMKSLIIKAGLTEENIDTSKINEVVEGYIIKNRTSGFKALSFLTEPNFIYMKEIDGKVSFASKKSSEEIRIDIEDIIINDDQLKFKISNYNEQKLPEKIDLNYIDSNSGYLVGSQSANRDGKQGIKKSEINLPVVMPKGKAKRVAEKLLLDEWNSAKIFELELDNSNLKIEIGDNLILTEEETDKYSMFVTKIDYDDKGSIKIIATNYDASVYDDYLGELLDESATTEAVEQIFDTGLTLLNLPLLASEDNKNLSVHFAVNSAGANWRGCKIYYSDTEDGEYSELLEIETEATIGFLNDDFEATTEFLIDKRSEIEVTINSSALESKTEEQFLTSKNNYAVIGEEIIKFENAELISQNTYKISNVKRGQFGTDKNISSPHIAGEKFILLNENVIKDSFSLNSFNKEIYFKPVTFGQNINEVEAESFILTGQNLKPYSVVNSDAIRRSNNDINISFNRRSRILNTWATPTTPLGEQLESYEIEILNEADEVVRTIASATNSIEYSVANQNEDFGENITNLKANIYQISDLVGRGEVTFLEKTL